MSKLNSPKKPAPRDWHRADIKAALEKSGWSLRRLSLANEYSESALSAALKQPYPKAERIIAAAIGIKPELIWPSRYNPDGTPNRPMGRPRIVETYSKKQSTSRSQACNVNGRGAA